MATLQDALRFAEEWDLPVFPCGPDKKPLTPHGFKDASCNTEAIAAMWPPRGALIGYPTGVISKLLVIDVDPDGLQWFVQHVDKLAPGVVVKTARGFHLLYRMPPEYDIRCSTSQVARGVDVRANGGYAVMWAAEGLPMTGDLADVTNIPEALLAKLTRPTAPPTTSTSARPTAPAHVNGSAIPEGMRNSTLASIAGKLHRARLGEHELRAALAGVNAALCKPPLPDAEVDRTALSIARYSVPVDPVVDVSAEVDMDDIQLDLTGNYVVKGLLALDSLATIIGAPKSGKTFFAGDLAVHIASGKAWRGHRVHGGFVMYVALEGLGNTKHRFYAMREAMKSAGMSLRLSGIPVNLRDPASVAALLERVRVQEQKFGKPCVAIFIDTLSRAMAGGDENHAEDMAALVAGADALRIATGACIVLVHHLGKDESRGARGHSLLFGAVDTEVTVSVQKGIHVAKVTGARNFAPGNVYAFKLPQVTIGTDADGDPVTTCLLTIEDQLPVPDATGSNQKVLAVALTEWRREHLGAGVITEAELVKVAVAQGLDRRRRPEVFKAFFESGRLIPCKDGFQFGS